MEAALATDDGFQNQPEKDSTLFSEPDSKPFAHPADSTGSLPVKQWKLELAGMSENLLNLSRSTEKEFLYLGNRLNHINSVNSQNSLVAEKVVSKLNQGKAANLNLIQKLLNDGFEKADRAESSLSVLSTELSKMLEGIDAIIHLNDSLDRTYRALSMVRVMIRIETENAGCLDFHTVAESLVTLEDLITENAGEIQQSSQETVELIRQIQAQFDADNNSQSYFKQKQKKILQLIAIISDEVFSCIQACGQMGNYTKAISKEIAEIVTQLQFHDNYRQRLEHISHTLIEVQNELPETGNAINEEASKLKPWGTTVINLQIAQLEKLKTENMNVSNTLSGSFEKILDLLQVQTDTADRVMPIMKSLDEHVEELDQLLNDFCIYLDQYKKANSELMASTAPLSKHVGGITRLSALIETNELNLRLLALNSMIKASAIGRQGKPLTVLSTEINTISQSVQQQISERVDIIDAIGTGSDNIGSNLLEKLKNSMLSAEESFDKTQETLLGLLEKDEGTATCSEVSHRLKTDFSDLMEKLQFSRITDEGLESVIGKLQNTCDDFERLLPDSPLDGEKAEIDLEELKLKYTMEAEREVHQVSTSDSSQMEGVQGSEDGSIELFDEALPQTPPPEDDLGDNFELF
jgi:methyl-accepting chemotaxis protein